MTPLVKELFDLHTDQAEPSVIDQTIRDNVRVVGTNLWVLFFAILVASVGLNVNSTAVVIGAMLISPLMGPIVGIGYGLGINDVDLLKLSLRNLGIFTALSIVTSTMYFAISPLDAIQPELLARTSPNLWDVLIAFFGGAAGIIALTRKSISNVVPGVAIATALMPPLCTAGFGIATGNWSFFFGAFFLYCINSVFIALATLLFVKIFHLPKHKFLDEITEKRTNMLIAVTAVLMIVPSGYLAFNLVQSTRFTQAVDAFVDGQDFNNEFLILAHEVRPQAREVVLTVGGVHFPTHLEDRLAQNLAGRGFAKSKVEVRYTGSNQVDINSLRTELTQSTYRNLVNQIESLSKENEQLTQQLASNSSLSEQTSSADRQLYKELLAQYPQIDSVTITRGDRFIHAKANNTPKQPINEQPINEQPNITANHNNTVIDTHSNQSEHSNPSDNIVQQTLTQVNIDSKRPLKNTDKQRITAWLDSKYEQSLLRIHFNSGDTEVTEILQEAEAQQNVSQEADTQQSH